MIRARCLILLALVAVLSAQYGEARLIRRWEDEPQTGDPT